MVYQLLVGNEGLKFMLTNTVHNIGVIHTGKNMYNSQHTLFLCILLLTLIICKILPAQFLPREYAIGNISTWISQVLIYFLFLMKSEQASE